MRLRGPATALLGVKLTVLSLIRFCPAHDVQVVCPSPPPDFRAWLRSLPHVTLSTEPVVESGWNVKPGLLLRLLQQGHRDVVWCDSDLIATAPFPPLLAGAPPEVLVTTEEGHWGKDQGGVGRTTAWGMVPGRRLPATANTSVLRVTPHHTGLL